MEIMFEVGPEVNPDEWLFDVPTSDRLWWSEHGPDFYSDPDAGLDAHLEYLANESFALDCLERGLDPHDRDLIRTGREYDPGDTACRAFAGIDERAEPDDDDHGDAVNLGPTCGHGLD